MSYKGQRGKKDACHDQIADWFKRCGWTWQDLHGVGSGCFDAIASWPDITIMVECKTGSERLSGGQLLWASSWPGLKLIVWDKATTQHLERQADELLRYGASRFDILCGQGQVTAYCQRAMKWTLETHSGRPSQRASFG